VITLFGETNPAQWHWSSPVSRMLRAPDQLMNSIQSKDILGAFEEMTANGA
jgi:hypothetical protein